MKAKYGYPEIKEMIYPTIFFLSSCGGFAKREYVGKMLREMFGVEEEDIKADKTNSGVPRWDLHLNDLRLEMIKPVLQKRNRRRHSVDRQILGMPTLPVYDCCATKPCAGNQKRTKNNKATKT